MNNLYELTKLLEHQTTFAQSLNFYACLWIFVYIARVKGKWPGNCSSLLHFIYEVQD